MENRWEEAEAQACVAQYAAQSVPETLALRVYSSRLIGSDPALVLHGGGNTSAKGTARDLLGNEGSAIYVKGSGWDLATIEPAGFPALRLEQVRAFRQIAEMTDEQMMNGLRCALLDPHAPNPSVEALLHAYLPHRFVDHTHADAILALVDQADAEARCRDVFGDKLAILPWVFPGFPLAGIAANAFERDPSVEGIVLLNHGLFTFGETARESYDRMVHYVTVAEEALAEGAARASGRGVTGPSGARGGPARDLTEDDLTAAMPVVRGALARQDASASGGYTRVVLHYRTSGRIRAFVDDERAPDYSQRGVATPDHIIRTKNLPMFLPPYEPGNLDGFAQACAEAVEAYQTAYRAYFEDGVRHSGQDKVMLDPMPRVLLLPGAGFFTAAPDLRAARIAADIYEHTIDIITSAERFGRYTPLPARELFEMEYWSLEQAKLGKGKEKRFARQVALITGAASGIGAATALAFAREGAHLALLDLDAARLEPVAAQVSAAGAAVEPLACDVTDASAVEDAFANAVRAFGGVDIVVSNAGRVWQGAIASAKPEDLRASFELNFFAHQTTAAQAVRIFERQGTGGQLLFNASKSAFNPGPDMGPYTLPKAAVVALMKQYAVEYGEIGVRSNAVNADRVPTALFGEGVLAQRAAARQVSVEEYLSGNLLRKMVRAEDVADAFVALASLERTTGAVVPVDGGNIAAAPR